MNILRKSWYFELQSQNIDIGVLIHKLTNNQNVDKLVWLKGWTSVCAFMYLTKPLRLNSKQLLGKYRDDVVKFIPIGGSINRFNKLVHHHCKNNMDHFVVLKTIKFDKMNFQ